MGWSFCLAPRTCTAAPRGLVSTLRGTSPGHLPTDSRSPRTWRMLRTDCLSEELCKGNTEAASQKERERREVARSGCTWEQGCWLPLRKKNG